MFENKTVLITGASSGIGRAIAESPALKDSRLILTARRIELLEEIKNNAGTNSRIEIIKCDVSNKEDVKSAFEKAESITGKIDIAILSAGIGIAVNPENLDSSAAEEVIKTNFLSAVYWIELLLPGFIKRKEGMIVGVSSLADNRAYGTSFYNPSKAALSIFLEGLRLDLKRHNIKVITVKPGFVKTSMTDQNNFKMPFLLTPQRAAEIILNGIAKEKKIIQFPLPTVLLTRMIGLLPLTVYEFLAGKTKK